MAQKLTVNYQGLDLNKNAVDTLDLDQVRSEKEDAMNGVKGYKDFRNWLAGGALAVTTLVLGFNEKLSEPMKQYAWYAVGTCAAGAAGSHLLKNTHESKARDLDMIELIKTNKPSGAIFPETYNAAAKTGLFVSKGCIC